MPVAAIVEGGAGTGEGGAANDWHAGFDDDTKSWLDTKGYSKLDSAAAIPELVKLGRSAEQKLGIPADQLLRMPKDDNDADGFKAVMAKLGAPETPDGYGLKVDDGQPDEFLKTATGWFHELGIPKRQAAGLAGKWNEYVASQQTAAAEAQKAQDESDYEALQKKWGDADYDAKIELGNRVIRSTGLSDEDATKIKNAIGLEKAATWLAGIGAGMGEHRFTGGEDGVGNFGALSPDAAKARIVALRSDKEWQGKMHAGDADKKAEWQRLHDAAYGNEPVGQRKSFAA